MFLHNECSFAGKQSQARDLFATRDWMISLCIINNEFLSQITFILFVGRKNNATFQQFHATPGFQTNSHF